MKYKVFFYSIIATNIVGQTAQVSTPLQRAANFKNVIDTQKASDQKALPQLHAINQNVFSPSAEWGNDPQGVPYFTAAHPFQTFPTTSLNETAVKSVFTNLTPLLKDHPTFLNYLLYFYFYLEYFTRLEKAAKLLYVYQQHNKNAKNDYQQFFTASYADRGCWQAFSQAVGSITQAPALDSDEYDDIWNIYLPDALSRTFTAENKDKSNYWQGVTTCSLWRIPVSSNDIKEGQFWQDWCHYVVVTMTAAEEKFLPALFQNEQQTFSFIPYLETAYYTPLYTQNRHSAEIMRISLILTQNCKQRALEDLQDWKNLSTKSLLNQIDHYKQWSNFFKEIQSITAKHPNQKVIKNRWRTYYSQELRLFSMALTLQSIQTELYNQENLATTMQTLCTQEKNLPSPSILTYSLDDEVYLESINELRTTVVHNTSATQDEIKAFHQYHPSTKTPLSPSSPPSEVEPTGLFSSVGGFFGWLFGLSAWDFLCVLFGAFVLLYRIVVDTVMEIYYSTGLARAFDSYLTPQQQELQAHAYEDALNTNLLLFGSDVKALITVAARAALDVFSGGIFPGVEVALLALGQTLHDPNLGLDFANMLESVADAAATALEGAGWALMVEPAYAMVRLTVDGIGIMTQFIVAAALGQQEAKVDCQLLAYDMVGTFLEGLTFAYTMVKDLLLDLVKAVSYLSNCIATFMIDVAAGIAALFKEREDPSKSLASWYQQEQIQMEPAEHIVAAVVNAVIMIAFTVAVTVATGGAAGPLMIGGLIVNAVLTVVMTAANIASAVSQYESAHLKMQTFDNYYNALKNSSPHQESFLKEQQQHIADEFQGQYNAEITNREISLGFYQNFFENLYNQFLNSEEHNLGIFQAALLQPVTISTINNQNKTYPQFYIGDPGSTYGVKTGWFNINPSQSLIIYEPSRRQFTQELAQSPSLAQTAEGTESRLWFLQNIIKNMASSPARSTFKIKFMPIYTLDEVHFGIGFGTQPLSITNIVSNQKGNLNLYSKAKFGVITRTVGNEPFSLKIYEYETTLPNTNYWMNVTPSGTVPQCIPGVWYYLEATLSDNTLTISSWEDGNEKNAVMVSSTVTPLPASLGTTVPYFIVYSGMAAAFEVITPVEIYSDVFYPSRNGQPTVQNLRYPQETEMKRESLMQKQFNALLSPQFNGVPLTPFSISELLKGHYVYRYTPPGSSMPDFVVFAYNNANATGSQINVDQTSNIANVSLLMGLSPMTTSITTNQGLVPLAVNSLVSLISNKIYQGSSYTYQPGSMWSLYATAPEHTKIGNLFGKQLLQEIYEAHCTYVSSLLHQTLNVSVTGPNFTSPSISLTLVSTAEDIINKGQFIYKAAIKQTVKNTKIYQSGSAVLDDYLVAAQLDNTGAPVTFGLPYDPILVKNGTINGFFSLVTTMTYPLTQTNIPSWGPGGPNQLNVYYQTYGKLSTPLQTALQKAQKIYQQSLISPPPPKPHTITLPVTKPLIIPPPVVTLQPPPIENPPACINSFMF